MKIKPNADVFAIPAYLVILQAKHDAPLMRGESVLRILVQARPVYRFVINLQVKFFPESLKAVQSQLRKNRN